MNLAIEIGLKELTNTILVNSGARTAFLLQPIDYGETKATDPKTAAILATIRKEFPDLKFTNTVQGVLVGRKSYTREPAKNTSVGMGEILGYPCAAEFESLDRNKTFYGYTINANYKGHTSVQILGNFCGSEKHAPEFQALAEKFQVALKESVLGPILKNVEVVADVEIPIRELVKAVASGKSLLAKEQEAIDNIFYNAGYSDDFQLKKFQMKNPIHRGILISILIHEQHDPLSPLFPIQDTGHKDEIEAVTAEQEKALLRVLRETRL